MEKGGIVGLIYGIILVVLDYIRLLIGYSNKLSFYSMLNRY
jgi:hypothetical protein